MKTYFTFTTILILLTSSFSFFDTLLETMPSCPPGNITLTTQQEVDDFTTDYPGCTEILGSLIIGPSTDIVNLDGLSGVTEIGKSLLIHQNAALSDMSGLSGVLAIGAAGGSIQVSSNDLLEVVDLAGTSAPNLFDVNVRENLVLSDLILPLDITTLSNNFDIYNNPFLENISEQDELISIGGYLQIHGTLDPVLPDFQELVSIGNGIIIYYNDLITALPPFLNLNDIFGGSLHFTNNPLVPQIDLSHVSAPNLVNATVRDNPVLIDLILPPDIITLSNNFDIYNNPILENISEQDELISIGGYLQIHGTLDPVLPDFQELVSIGNGIVIYYNDLITALPPFLNLTDIFGGSLHFTNNPLVPQIDLSHVSAPNLVNATVRDNPVLIDLILPLDIITLSNNFDIYNNPILENISEQDELISIGGYLQIHGTLDPVLPDFQELVSIGNGIVIYYNDLITALPPFLNLTDIFGGSLHFTNNPLVPQIDLSHVSAPNLVNATVRDNPVLIDLILPLDIITLSNNFDIYNNPILENISEQDELISIGGYLQIHGTLDPVLPDFQELVSIGNGIVIYYNDLITALPPFLNLTDIFGGSLHFTNNPLVPQIDLSHVSAPNLVNATVRDNFVLVDLFLPSNITTIDHEFIIYNNTQLENINDQNNLIEIKKNLVIYHTQVCTFPNFQSLTTVGSSAISNSSGLQIGYNANITHLNVFPNLVNLDSSIHITNNPLLSNCAIQAVCDFLPTTKNRNISNNTGDCLDEAAVQNHCDNGPTILEPEYPDDMLVTTGTTVNLSITNLPTNYESIWYEDDMTTILYQDVANSFDYTVNETTTLYGAFAPLGTNCNSNLEPLLLTAKNLPSPAPLTLTVQYTASQCESVGTGTASVFARGGAQAIGTGQFSGIPQNEFPQWGFRTKSADLNGDGYLDITAGEGGRPITIWTNNGDAIFSESFQFDYPYWGGDSGAHDLGDLDGDGDIDIFTNNENYHLVVLFNDGNANFTAGPDFHFGRRKFAIELGDLDGDGDLDALEIGHGANSSTHELRPWFNDGNGVFTQGVIYYPTTSNFSNNDMVLADLDGDGDLDAYLPQFSTLSGAGDEVWLNNGDGTFVQNIETYGFNDNTQQVAAGDLDNDGDIDIFASNHLTPSRVLLNDGDGTFSELPELYGDNCCGAGEVELTDFNCDGILDAVIGRVGNNSTLVYSGNGDGTFSILEDLSNAGPGGNLAAGTIGIDVGDYDNDGDIDIAAGRIHGLGAVYLNDQAQVNPYTYQWDDPNNQTEATATNLLAGFYSVIVTDADGTEAYASVEINGPPALGITLTSTPSTCGDANDGTATANGSGGGEFTLKPNGEDYLIDNEIATGISFGDLDGDGDLDIFNTNYRTGALDMPDRVWFNDGDGTFTQSNENYSQGLITTRGKLGDFDQDGDLDVFQSGVASQVVLHNDGDGTFTAIENFVEGLPGIVGQDWNALDVGDVNGDGYLDAVVGSDGYEGFLVYINDGDGTFTRVQRQISAESIRSIALGDIDGDGDLDFFAAGSYVESIVYFNDGTGNFTQGNQSYGGNNRYDGVGLADFDFDGDLDAFFTGSTGQKNLVLHNNGDGTFIKMQSNFGEYGSSVNIGDIDGDGDLDVFTAGYDKGSSIFLNRGDGTFDDFPQGFPRFGSYQISDIGDLDGDGDLDVTVGHFGRLDVLLNEPNCFTYKWSGNAGGQTTQTAINLGPGNYNVTATDASGCKVYGSVEVQTVPDFNVSEVGPFCHDGLQYYEFIISGNSVTYDLTNNGSGSLSTTNVNNNEPFLLYDLNENDAWSITIDNPLNAACTEIISGMVSACSTEPDCEEVQSESPAPELDETQSEIIIQRGGVATLVLENYPVGATVVWYDEDQSTLLYSDVANNFQPTVPHATTYFGGYLDPITGCSSVLLPVLVKAYYPLTARVESYNASCSDASDGSAQVIAKGGRQSIGTGNFVESEERYGIYGTRVLLEDFNGDGYLDIYGSHNNTFDDVWINDGDGTFTYQTIEYNSEKSGVYATGADFDNDGDIDIYVANTHIATDKVLINNGIGLFTEMPQSYGISDTQGAATGDLNGDGNVDIIVTGSGFVLVLVGNGDGTFNQQSNIGNLSYKGRSVKLGDLDNDGDLDAFVTNGSGLGATTNPPNPNQVYLNDGNANFTLVPEDYGTNESSWEVSLGDIDNDGDLDAVIANWFNFEDQIYLNDGDGTFTENTQNFTPNFSTRGVELGDMDRDGDLDIVFAHFDYYSGTGSASVRYWINDGSGNYSESSTSHPEATDIAIGDIDKDGDLDVFVCNGYNHIYNGRLNYILFNDNSQSIMPYSFDWSGGTLYYTPDRRINLSNGNYSVEITEASGTSITSNFEVFSNLPIDLTIDATDATCQSNNDGTASVNISGGAPFGFTYDDPILTIGDVADYTIVLEDLDSDNDLDIIGGLNNRVIGINDGAGNFTEIYEPSLPTGASPYLIGDLDSDGHKDIVAIVQNTGSFGVFISNGDLTYQASINHSANGLIRGAQLGDLDNDGDLDLFIGLWFGKPNYIFLNDGTGNFSEQNTPFGSEDTYDAKLGDLDNDGDLDIFTANMGDGDIVWLNDGNANFTNHFSLPSGIASWSIELGDFDADGDLDVVAECYGLQPTRVYLNNGDATFTLSNQAIPNIHPHDVEVGDYDNDGDLDILTNKTWYAGIGIRGGTIWLNDGTGYFIEYRQNSNSNLLNISFSSALESGDIDNDGDLDIVTNGGNGITILRNSPMTYTYQWNDPNAQTTQTANDLGPGTYDVIVTDFRGCDASASVTVNAPLLECNATATISTNNLCQATLTVEDILSDPTICEGQITFTVFDENGNQITNGIPPLTFGYSPYYGQTLEVEARETDTDNFCTTILTIIDEISPSISCPMNTTIECDASTDPSNTGEPIVLDNCDPNPSVTFIDEVNLNGCGNYTGTILRTWTVSDGSGNLDSCTQIITVEDNTDPEFNAPNNITIQCDQDYTDLSITGDVSNINDNCDPNPILSFVDNINLDGCGGYTGTVTRIWTITDACGNDAGAIQIITIEDSSGPSFDAPGDILIPCSADPTDLDITGNASNLVDNCDANPTISYMDDIELNACEGGTINRSWMATDECGNSTIIIQRIRLNPPLPPSISCPPNQEVNCASDIVVNPDFAIVTTDCDLGYFVYTTNPEISGAPDCNGTTYSYRYITVDDCGNTAECTQVFTINHPAPTLNCLPDETVTCFADIEVSINDVTVTGSCDDSPQVVLLPVQIDGPLDCPGTTYTYTYQLNDGCGSLVTCQRIFTNGQNEAPTIIAPIDITCECLAGINPNIDHAIISTSCGNNVDYTVEVSDPVINGALDCPGTTYTYTYTVIDACGRIATDDQVFTVNNSAPIMECPEVCLVENCEDEGYEEIIEAWLFSVTANSSCGVSLDVINDYDPSRLGLCIHNGFTEVNFYAIDDCGRTTVCTGMIVITDTEPPFFIEEAQDMFVICNYSTPSFFNNWVENNGGAVAEDGCWEDEITWHTIPANPSINCDDQNTAVTVTFVATDGCGNQAFTTATFTALIPNNDDRNNNIGDQENLIEVQSEYSNPILFQNEPNPFKGVTNISFYLPLKTEASLIIYDVAGKELKRINGNYEKGIHQLSFDETDIQAKGILFYQLNTPYGSLTKRMIMID